MNTRIRSLLSAGALCAFGLFHLAPSTQDPAQAAAQAAANPKVVVGTYDSRALAVAHVRSPAFAAELKALHAEHQAAVRSGDKARAAELEQKGAAMQDRAHQQGFGTAPIDEIVDRIRPQLPAIATKAGVDVIVSKWELDYTAPAARFVDVTEVLVAEFHPDEGTQKAIRELLKTAPLPDGGESHR